MIITISGDNQYAVRAETASVIDKFVAQHGSLAVERFDAAESEVEQILSSLSGLSFLSPQKLVVIKDFETNKALTDRTEELIQQAPDDTTVLITIGKLDKRLAYGKLLKKATDWREFGVLSPQETVAWVVKTTDSKGGQIERPTAQYLIDFVGGDQLRLSNELDKLITYSRVVTRQTIDNLCQREPSSTVFELLDAGFNGHQKKALNLYEEQRRQHVEPLAMIGMIGWQLHVLALVKTGKDKSAADIAKDAGVHPFVVQKSIGLARTMALSKLKQLVHQAVVLEEKLKNQTMNADDAVKHYLLSL